jgi:hypothetical protein
MADQIQQTGGSRQTGQGSSKGGTDTAQGVREQATAAGREFKDKATDFAASSGEKLREQASELADAAKGMASQAADRLKQTASEKKGAGAEYVGSLAETMRRAAREFDNDLPIAGKYIRKAASQVENVSDSLRTGDFNDLIESAQSFARRQPTAFLGCAALAGFVAVRFLKSSSEAGSGSRSFSSQGQHQGQQSSGTQYRGPVS